MFYENFTNICNENGISPTATLQKLNISTSKLTAWKNGSTPSATVLLLISEFFCVSIDYLLKGKEYKNTTRCDNIQSINAREKEALRLFRTLPEEEQLKLIGRMEMLSELYKTEESAV